MFAMTRHERMIFNLGAGRNALSLRLRHALAPMSEDMRAALSGLLLGGFGLLGSASVATFLGSETVNSKIAAFVGFALCAWAAVLVGEAVFTRRDDRLSIEREGLIVSYMGGRYFAPWRMLGQFRVSNGAVLIEDLRLQPHYWRALFAPMALDPAFHDLGTAEQMCAELNTAREAALRDEAM
jgi:hypothetical protein